MQGEKDAAVEALAHGDLDSAPLPDAEKILLTFVRKLTLTPARMTDEDAAALRSAGWTDPQMAEAVYITAMFAFFNRVADAFGLAEPGYRKQGMPKS